MRYASLDASMLRREAIRGLLNPGAKPASQLNPLAVFAGAGGSSSLRALHAATTHSRDIITRYYIVEHWHQVTGRAPQR